MAELVVPALIGGAVAGGASYIISKDQQKASSKAVKKQRAYQEQREAKAGEHFDELNREQMELQSQQNQIQLLSDIITTKREKPPQVLQLPPAKTYTVAERINSAIGDLIKGR